MIRTIGGIVAGIIVFMATIMLMELLAHALFPARQADVIPAGMQIFVVAAYLLGAFAGGLVAVRLSGAPWTAWLMTLLILIGAAYTVATMPHPLLMKIGGLLAPLVGGLLAHHFGRPRNGPARAHADA